MTKNLKLTFILYAVATAIVVAWRTLYSYFSGAGINLVAHATIFAVIIGLCVSDKHVYNRSKDLLYSTGFFVLLELITFFGLEFAVKSYSHIPGFLIYQNVLSIMAIFYFAYLAFRFITEYRCVKIKFIEILLGNEKIAKKPKKAKELTNGTLEEKPKSVKENEINDTFTSTETTEEEIIITEPENKDEE